jgi:threonine/homoserine/homoserine lactone efflux protein
VLAQLLAFLGVSAVVICVPGPDTALTVRNALAGGRRGGVATAAGVATGQAVWTLATGVGIAELIHASDPAFLALRVAGAAYLVALGLQSLWHAAVPHRTPLWTAERTRLAGRLPSRKGPQQRRGAMAHDREHRDAMARVRGPGGELGPGGEWRQGLVSNLANPKMAAFFLSLLPQFAGPGSGLAGVLGLGALFCLMTFGWLALYSAAVDRARRVLARSKVRRALEAVSGVVLVGFGARLALQQR